MHNSYKCGFMHQSNPLIDPLINVHPRMVNAVTNAMSASSRAPEVRFSYRTVSYLDTLNSSVLRFGGRRATPLNFSLSSLPYLSRALALASHGHLHGYTLMSIRHIVRYYVNLVVSQEQWLVSSADTRIVASLLLIRCRNVDRETLQTSRPILLTITQLGTIVSIPPTASWMPTPCSCLLARASELCPSHRRISFTRSMMLRPIQMPRNGCDRSDPRAARPAWVTVLCAGHHLELARATQAVWQLRSIQKELERLHSQTSSEIISITCVIILLFTTPLALRIGSSTWARTRTH